MQQPVAYIDGRFVPQAEAAVPFVDAGFVLGAAVSEQLRTANGAVFLLAEHPERLRLSARTTGIELPQTDVELEQIVRELVARNWPLAASGGDLGISIVLTPGIYSSFAREREPRPALYLHTYELPFARFQRLYTRGQSLVVVDVRQVPETCWPRSLKCRSRMHYHLADQQARAHDPDARALLLDQDGTVNETSTASVLLHLPGAGLVAPPSERVLPGITLDFVRGLAAGLGVSYAERDIAPSELHSADEILLTSTPFGIAPACRVDGKMIGDGKPGSMFTRLLRAFGEAVGIDLARQAAQMAGVAPEAE